MATVPAIRVGPFDRNPCHLLNLVDLIFQRMAIIGAPGQRHGADDELAALCGLVCDSQGRFAPELISGSGFSLPDAFDLWRVQCIELDTRNNTMNFARYGVCDSRPIGF
jgi:hypothetical protein